MRTSWWPISMMRRSLTSDWGWRQRMTGAMAVVGGRVSFTFHCLRPHHHHSPAGMSVWMLHVLYVCSFDPAVSPGEPLAAPPRQTCLTRLVTRARVPAVMRWGSIRARSLACILRFNCVSGIICCQVYSLRYTLEPPLVERDSSGDPRFKTRAFPGVTLIFQNSIIYFLVNQSLIWKLPDGHHGLCYQVLEGLKPLGPAAPRV